MKSPRAYVYNNTRSRALMDTNTLSNKVKNGTEQRDGRKSS